MVTDDAELFRLITDWYGRGILTDLDKGRLRARYLSDLGTSTCTTCPDWLRDMQTHFRIYLKQQNLLIMSSTKNQYLIDPAIGSFRSPQHNFILVNPGTALTDGLTYVTDEIATALMNLDEGYKPFFVTNPDYVAPSKKETGAAADSK